jgi:nucleoid-associated protein YgaU
MGALGRFLDREGDGSVLDDVGGLLTYTVVKGDSLSKIAKREYGDANKWHKIFEANKDVIDDPDLIEVGQDLIIPE